MKKLIVPLMIVQLIVLVGPGYGRTIPTRVAEKEYTAAGYYDAAGVYAQNYCMSVNDNNTGGACFDLRPGENTILVEVRDESGVPVRGRIVRRGKPDVFFCGATKTPVTVPAKQKEVSITLGVEGCGAQPAVPTRGVIAATFD